MASPRIKARRRNKCFGDTQNEMIETAVRPIAERGVDSLSIAAVARAMGINRTTVYYHFDSRDRLIAEVKAWSSSQLAEAFSANQPRPDRIEHIYRFVLENPDLVDDPNAATAIWDGRETASRYLSQAAKSALLDDPARLERTFAILVPLAEITPEGVEIPEFGALADALVQAAGEKAAGRPIAQLASRPWR